MIVIAVFVIPIPPTGHRFLYQCIACNAMKTNSRVLNVSVTVWSTALFALGCGQSTAPSADFTRLAQSDLDERNTYSTSSIHSPAPVYSSLTFVEPEHVRNIFKRKCYICHGGAETKGGFDLRQMKYQPERKSNWQPMDLAGVTRIKLAILPLEGNPAKMPKKAGSIWNPLTVEEANAVAKWTDYPYER